eukprot:11910979-Alexandrium_andersonii.AAC.1
MKSGVSKLKRTLSMCSRMLWRSMHCSISGPTTAGGWLLPEVGEVHRAEEVVRGAVVLPVPPEAVAPAAGGAHFGAA